MPVHPTKQANACDSRFAHWSVADSGRLTKLADVLTLEQLAEAGSATMRVPSLTSCLLLTQCGRHLTCVIAGDAAEDPAGLRLLDTRVIRFVDNGWSEQPAAELHVVRDGAQWGVCDAQRRWWVPHHSLLPYRLVDLAPAERLKLLGHIAGARPWDVFKYIQLVYLGEDGFSGGRDALCAVEGYGDQVRPDRWYLSAPECGR